LDAAWPVFQKAGALAIVLTDREKNNVLNAHDMLWGARLLRCQEPRSAWKTENRLCACLKKDGRDQPRDYERDLGETKVNNVIAEIRGSERPDEWILIGAHLDSWDFATGAQDNGAGSASVLEVARVFASLGKSPRRSIRFALWGGKSKDSLGLMPMFRLIRMS